MSRKRAIALVAAAAAVFPFVFATPGHAIDAASNCRTVVPGPTPSVEIDKDNDGNPEVRVPSLSNVNLCVWGDVQLDDSPNWWSEPCNRQGTCQRVFIHYALSGEASAQAQLCFSVDGVPSCGTTTPIRIPLDFIKGGTACIGVDAGGGSPCGGGTSFISFS
ncbi:MAG TPA: hypothetical protein VHN37_11265 [Actinomycetota bacterium]|nr:hypothetical protein [Actinomycetota bacterium]